MKRIRPNYITAFRLFVLAPFVCFLLTNNYLASALAMMLLAEFTDIADGYIARKTNQVSDLGKLLDPASDTFLHMLIWMSFLSLGWVPLWAVAVFFFRDAAGSSMRQCLAANGIVLAARPSGKAKAFSQAVAQLVLVLMNILGTGANVQATAIMFAVLITLYSLVDYSRCFYQTMKSTKTNFDWGFSSRREPAAEV